MLKFSKNFFFINLILIIFSFSFISCSKNIVKGPDPIIPKQIKDLTSTTLPQIQEVDPLAPKPKDQNKKGLIKWEGRQYSDPGTQFTVSLKRPVPSSFSPGPEFEMPAISFSFKFEGIEYSDHWVLILDDYFTAGKVTYEEIKNNPTEDDSKIILIAKINRKEDKTFAWSNLDCAGCTKLEEVVHAKSMTLALYIKDKIAMHHVEVTPVEDDKDVLVYDLEYTNANIEKTFLSIVDKPEEKVEKIITEEEKKKLEEEQKRLEEEEKKKAYKEKMNKLKENSPYIFQLSEILNDKQESIYSAENMINEESQSKMVSWINVDFMESKITFNLKKYTNQVLDYNLELIGQLEVYKNEVNILIISLTEEKGIVGSDDSETKNNFIKKEESSTFIPEDFIKFMPDDVKELIKLDMKSEFLLKFKVELDLLTGESLLFKGDQGYEYLFKDSENELFLVKEESSGKMYIDPFNNCLELKHPDVRDFNHEPHVFEDFSNKLNFTKLDDVYYYKPVITDELSDGMGIIIHISKKKAYDYLMGLKEGQELIFKDAFCYTGIESISVTGVNIYQGTDKRVVLKENIKLTEDEDIQIELPIEELNGVGDIKVEFHNVDENFDYVFDIFSVIFQF
ncbi:MAG: hypothetical protein ABIA04_05960 [Pseudomonadota bacterium]